MHKSLLIGLLAVALASVASTLFAQGWGDLTGKFVVEGKPPKPDKIKADDVDCNGEELFDESLVVDAKGGVANVVVWLETAEKIKPHPSYEKQIAATVNFDNAKCRFAPHVAIALAGQTVHMGNQDGFGHNINAVALTNGQFNEIVPSKGKLVKVFKKEERLPITCACNIHRYMKGYLFVKNHPYIAVSAADGTFTIKNMPEGAWTMRVWHERNAYVKKTKIQDKQTDNVGKIEVTIANGKVTDWGTVILGAETLKK